MVRRLWGKKSREGGLGSLSLIPTDSRKDSPVGLQGGSRPDLCYPAGAECTTEDDREEGS